MNVFTVLNKMFVIVCKGLFCVNSPETALLNKDLLEVLPGVEEANAISEELDKKVKFEIMLLSPQWLGKTSGRTEVSFILLIFPFLFHL